MPQEHRKLRAAFDKLPTRLQTALRRHLEQEARTTNPEAVVREVGALQIEYTIALPAPGSIPNYDPWEGYGPPARNTQSPLSDGDVADEDPPPHGEWGV